MYKFSFALCIKNLDGAGKTFPMMKPIIDIMVFSVLVCTNLYANSWNYPTSKSKRRFSRLNASP